MLGAHPIGTPLQGSDFATALAAGTAVLLTAEALDMHRHGSVVLLLQGLPTALRRSAIAA